MGCCWYYLILLVLMFSVMLYCCDSWHYSSYHFCYHVIVRLKVGYELGYLWRKKSAIKVSISVVIPLNNHPFHPLSGVSGVWSRVIPGTPNNGTPLWEASHTIPTSLGILMGVVWEWYGKLPIRGSHYWGSLKIPLIWSTVFSLTHEFLEVTEAPDLQGWIWSDAATLEGRKKTGSISRWCSSCFKDVTIKRRKHVAKDLHLYLPIELPSVKLI